ncbi:MAG: putative 2-hydroxyhepta-2,4-diene,7-dioate isomerase [Caulobacteraceae bacterium]|nr:putative 2-hydroxyhepta-2,4-diene,7-dioate isomerase [Caulobacteraceae bacterium]
MKLCRYGLAGQEKPGILDKDGAVRDLSGLLGDITATNLTPTGLAALSAIDVERLPLAEGASVLSTPWTGIGKYLCIGLNYSDHAAESNMPIPPEPIIFTKAVTAINGPNDPIVKPLKSTKLDWEVELGIVIGTRASYVSKEDALDHVAGFVLLNDVSERAFQLQSQQWDKGKGCDTFGPIGPWLVTKDEVPDVQKLGMWLNVNGQRRQTGNTATMIFDVKTIVSYVSAHISLMPGDVIATGTPPGVGMGIKPEAVYLNVGDVVELGIDGLGVQRQQVVAHPLAG